MKITIEIVCDDPKEAARTMQALANRIDSLPAETKPPKTTTRTQAKEKTAAPYPPLIEPDEQQRESLIEVIADEPTEEQIDDAAGSLAEAAITSKEQGSEAIAADQPADGAKKPWCRKYPNGCKICGTTERKHMGGGKCSRCYFK